ncbi:FMN-binding glutamate synthase family protein [Granulosicoccus antarcticus]|uniref:Glutamate synthase [NADPH] large chain n=1 Tax=Granulosicoccus antarcticus IMCC3135 TaxID=1192854 RepID=A0A2Z2P1Q8_9GAMM|nr:FMN-binding glutamate synthase family protein [Granulosicoccus antarcticus]ASJ73554.1 Glutamate synthase [NADPH] large chain [Granulosicoccus antarcticus IMCC3135]
MLIRQYFLIFAVSAPILLLGLYTVWTPAVWILLLLVPIIALGIIDVLQTKQTIRRLYPVLGRFRYLLESIRTEIQQYFVESDTSGTPIPREFRSLVYQRAKGDRDTRPFGTIFDVNRPGYEWMNHSLQPKHAHELDPRVEFGAGRCAKPYMASPLNISAMSYGALSKSAIRALNKGASIGGFSHNTGEGSLSPYHLEAGGDIVWQIGTGYFGCRTQDGNFDAELFQKSATLDVVKMIEIKLSQGAKPGHGGILPAAKLTEEIAQIRLVPMGQDVVSPAGHSAFSTPLELLDFVEQLRELSGGKPVGFKLCIGRRDEFLAICKAMKQTGKVPDFITVDGGEGGTGAAPTEMTNSLGTPLRDALIFVNQALIGTGLRNQIRIIASGKILTAFHLLRVIALGADTANSARGMMLALGCIQSRTCNTDHCPTGIATQNPARAKGLVVSDKATRVANFHRATIAHLAELIAAAGLDNLDQLEPRHINHRVQGATVKTYAQLYPVIEEGCLLNEMKIPDDWKDDWQSAQADRW